MDSEPLERNIRGKAAIWPKSFAGVTPAQIEEAGNDWRLRSDPTFTGLLFGRVFVFDSATLHYKVSNRIVSSHAIKIGFMRYVKAQQKQFSALSKRMLVGELTVAEWQLRMAEVVRYIHISVQAIASGGLDNIDVPSVLGRLEYQYKRLKRFAIEVSKRSLGDAVIIHRSTLYGLSAAGVYENTRRDLASALYSEERRVMTTQENCSVCEAQADLGWQSFGELNRIGQSPCQMACLCEFEFRKIK